MTNSYVHCLRPGTPVVTVDGGASGNVVGVAHMSPVCGHTYIVRLDLRSSAAWKNYPYECAAIPRSHLRINGTQDLVALYEGEVQFYEENSNTPEVIKACGVRRLLFEPYKLQFSFMDGEQDIYSVYVLMSEGAWKGSYGMSREGQERPIYHGELYHVLVEDRQGTLIVNASMEEAGSPQHLTLRAKCLGEKALVEEETDVE